MTIELLYYLVVGLEKAKGLALSLCCDDAPLSAREKPYDDNGEHCSPLAAAICFYRTWFADPCLVVGHRRLGMASVVVTGRGDTHENQPWDRKHRELHS